MTAAERIAQRIAQNKAIEAKAVAVKAEQERRRQLQAQINRLSMGQLVRLMVGDEELPAEVQAALKIVDEV
jgi:hypothetical protein